MGTDGLTHLEAELIPVALTALNGRGRGTILWRLESGPMRTSAIRRSIPEIGKGIPTRYG